MGCWSNAGMKRRAYVAALGAAGSSSLGGCLSSLASSPKEAKLSDVSIVNLNDEPHTVTVTIANPEKTLFEKTFELERDAASGTESNLEPVIREDWMDEPDRYTITTRIDDREDPVVRRIPTENRLGDCYWVVIRIRENGRVEMPYDENASGCS